MTALRKRSASVAAGLLVAVVMVCAYSGWSVVGQARGWSRELEAQERALRVEHAEEIAQVQQQRQRWQARWRGAQRGLQVELSGRALGLEVLRQRGQDLADQGESRRQVQSQRDEETLLILEGMSPEDRQELSQCMHLLERAEEGFLQGLGGVLTGEVSAEAARCRQVLGQKQMEIERLYEALRSLEQGAQERTRALSAFWKQGSAQMEERLMQRVVLGERLDEERALELGALRERDKYLNQLEILKKKQVRQIEALRARGWSDVLEARGLEAWSWWLHAGSFVLGLQVALVLVLRLLHLRGWGTSLRLGRVSR